MQQFFFAEAAIKIKSIYFDTSTSSISYEFENVSDKDIAYISFETYFYDRMGGALQLDDFSGDYAVKLKYTGSLYEGGSASTSWDYIFSMPSSTAVVYPKKITVTFTDDKKVTFENDFYAISNDFYGGKLKNKK